MPTHTTPPTPPHEPHRPGPVAAPPDPRPSPAAPRGPVLTTATGPGVLDPVLDRLLTERIVFLGSEVDDDTANRITAQLLLLAAHDPDADITLYINSPGGSVTAGMAIYDTMTLIAPDVATWGIGMAASMGQFLLCAGTPGKRHALAHTRILMHQPSAGVSGTVTDIVIRAGVHAELKREIARLTAQHTGQDVATITADADRDHWFTAEQAREYGMVDHVVGAGR